MTDDEWYEYLALRQIERRREANRRRLTLHAALAPRLGWLGSLRLQHHVLTTTRRYR